MQFLVFGDMHLSYEEDAFRAEYLEEELELESYDYFVTTGNVMEDVRKFEDDEAQGAIEFYDTLNEWGKEYNIETLAIPGNLDFHMYTPFIHNMKNRHHIREASKTTFYTHKTGADHEPGYVFVANGADSWDQGATMNPDKYNMFLEDDENRADKLEKAVEQVGWDWPPEPLIRDAADDLGIPIQQRKTFQEDAKEYRERFDEVKGRLGGKDQDGEFEVIYLNHVPPFNTELDDLDGSIADKNGIKHYEPRLAISGHRGSGRVDTIGEETLALNSGKRQLLRVDISGTDVEFEFLNSPDL